jgi:hypothetical protein
MSKQTITFSECEHEGDVENYKQDLIKSGATILEVTPNFDEEEVTIVIEVDKYFTDEFKKTDSYNFIV